MHPDEAALDILIMLYEYGTKWSFSRVCGVKKGCAGCWSGSSHSRSRRRCSGHVPNFECCSRRGPIYSTKPRKPSRLLNIVRPFHSPLEVGIRRMIPVPVPTAVKNVKNASTQAISGWASLEIVGKSSQGSTLDARVEDKKKNGCE
jgi:hypothetical protein